MADKNIIICDLDGTLADIQHRRHFVERPKCPECKGTGWKDFKERGDMQCGCKSLSAFKPDWPAFFKACTDDTPIQTTIEVVSTLTEMDNELWVVSGRSDEVMDETVSWLNHYVGHYHQLIMRRKGDYTPDHELKEGWLRDGTIPIDRVFCVFDDRARVVKMWREMGLTCYQVADGDF